MEMKGNTVLITGGGAGIGLALAKELLARNNEVVVCDLQQEKLDAAKKQLPRIGTILCDVNSPRDREALLLTVQKDYPRLNIFVNNAGVVSWNNFLAPAPDLPERISLEVNTNLLAPMELTRLFLPQLLQGRKSALVNITSGLAYVPLAQEPIYCAAKAGLHSFSQSIRYQLKDTPVKVVEILSSWVDTDMARKVEADKMTTERVVKEILRGMEKDQEEIRIGKINVLYFMSRLAPHWMFKNLNDHTPAHQD
ncbi:MAG TPA: SDR family NAD(P)-dependent oxidoreductase [bacterium]|nr:SDR family NAD(P)-dependent oxidoreductase [bacterium]